MGQRIHLVRWPEMEAQQYEREAALLPYYEKGRYDLLHEMAKTARENPNPNRCRVVEEIP